jgi:hypothetical protein
MYKFIIFIYAVLLSFIIYVKINISKVEYIESEWNKENIVNSMNCYSFVLNDIDSDAVTKCKESLSVGKNECRSYFSQPGMYFKRHTLNRKESEIVKLKDEDYTCKNLLDLVKKDNPSITINESECKNGYLGALAVSPKDDYHFYRKIGNWTHKNGSTMVSNTDEQGKVITDPQFADRGIYSEFCGYMCIPSNDTMKTNSAY